MGFSILPTEIFRFHYTMKKNKCFLYFSTTTPLSHSTHYHALLSVFYNIFYLAGNEKGVFAMVNEGAFPAAFCMVDAV